MAAPAIVREPAAARTPGDATAHREPPPFFNPFYAEPEVTFTMDESLECIEIFQEMSIRALYCSSNMARVTMGTFPAQYCSAFLCSLESVKGFPVYVAFFLSESSKVLVYTPDKLPETIEECDDTVREGIRFIETVGLIMDRVEMGGEMDLENLMGSIPALRQVLCRR